MSVVDMNNVSFDNAVEISAAEYAGLPVERNLEVVAAEINVIKAQTASVINRSVFEIGKRLCEAKGMIGHGNWEAWLRDNVAYSETTARTLMRAYREMGGEQVDMLTGEAPIDVFESLNLSQMVALFPLPQSERAAFVKEHNVAELSVRDIDKLVAEATEKGRAEAAEEYAARENELEDRLEAATAATEKAESAREQWNKIASDMEKQRDELKVKHEAEVRKLKEKEDKLLQKLEAIKAAPVQEKVVYVEKEAEQTEPVEAPSTSEREDKLEKELEVLREQLAQAEQRATASAQKADARVQAVNFSIRMIAEQLDAIGDAIGQIRGGTQGNGELADKLSEQAGRAIKSMLEGAEWYES